MELEKSIKIIPGIGPRRYDLLNKLGIETFHDLIYYFPRAYRDFSNITPISSCRIHDEVIIRATVTDISSNPTRNKKMSLVKATLLDEDGNKIKAVWFNQRYIVKNLPINSTWYFSGKIGFDFSTREKTLNAPEYQKKPIILPIYHETEGINSKYLAKIINFALAHVAISDWLTEEQQKDLNVFSLPQATKQAHFPQNQQCLTAARHRLSFDELFFLSLKLQLRKSRFQSFPAPQITFDQNLMANITSHLPFVLTQAQQAVLDDIVSDVTKQHPMTRLINGDVGSGKTVVAGLTSVLVAKNHYQAVWLAPTEILAMQHYQTITKLFEDEKISVGLYTAKQQLCTTNVHQKKGQALKDQILQSDIVIGTHALLEDKINFAKVGLVVVDEEHRFGVVQRGKLLLKNKHLVPHYLAMTATPIPRTLATAIYADFDISVIDQLPKGRKKIITKIVSRENRQKAYEFIHAHIQAGRQCFVVCPLIEENKQEGSQEKELFELEKKSVKKEYENLRTKIFPDLKIAMLHGKMHSEDKKNIMDDFSQKKTDILVSTSVIEVGVDVPNANIMMIEGADRFGLAQLHQFRGRVGRGTHQSFCFLFTENATEKIDQRLKALENNDSGFRLAQIDLNTRGPGEIIGSRQSGYTGLKVAHLTDTITLAKAKKFAQKIIADGLDKYPTISDIINSSHAQK